MKKISLLDISHVRWGKLLLPAGLLLVAVSGILQLYEVQAVLFPANYHATQINLIKKECIFIDEGFASLRIEVARLDALCATAKRLSPGSATPSSAGSAAPQPPDDSRITSESAWQATLHAAKKKRVYVARKLRYIDAMLQSMQRAIEQQEISRDVALVPRRPEFQRTLRRIQIIQTRSKIYSSELDKLSEKLNQLAGCGKSSFVKK